MAEPSASETGSSSRLLTWWSTSRIRLALWGAFSCSSRKSRSTLLRMSMGLSPSVTACASTRLVCTVTPSTTSTTRMALSEFRRAAVTSELKSKWPGQSMRFRTRFFASSPRRGSVSLSSPLLLSALSVAPASTFHIAKAFAATCSRADLRVSAASASSSLTGSRTPCTSTTPTKAPSAVCSSLKVSAAALSPRALTKSRSACTAEPPSGCKVRRRSFTETSALASCEAAIPAGTCSRAKPLFTFHCKASSSIVLASTSPPS
mmetsp:Transcript_13210/g.49006  ORF Transcript_13210/g.49006 Transcript_13210/m.49006 type:complete len:262 (+) Transcript_13210:2249-3034(+)